MALRALLFSKNPETADSLTAVLREAGIRAEVCADIFAAIEKGAKQPFACIIADWSDQPEAGFLLKRARESGPSRMAVVIAIVEGEPTPDEEREHRLDFLIYLPIVADEARAVLAKASQQMKLQSPAYAADASAALDQPDLEEPSEPQPEDPNLVSIASDLPEPVPQAAPEEQNEEATFADEPSERFWLSRAGLRVALVAALMLTAAFFFWKSRETFSYLGRTPEGTFHVLRESVAALFSVNKSRAQTVTPQVQPDAYFARTPANPNAKAPVLGVVAVEISWPDRSMHSRPAYDLPLPTPTLHVDPLPTRVERAAVPDSLKSAAPIARPVVVTVSPAQMMPVSAPTPQVPQYAEPVLLSEDSARALVVHSVDAAYPPEARAHKLQGLVVLQAVIGRDGNVQDLKLVRGYFVLAKAAIAAVKQWRFRPYTQNGRALETQTIITIAFSYPPG
jgi:TonB family protein